MTDFLKTETESSFEKFMNSLTLILLAVEPTKVAGIVTGLVANIAPPMIKIFQKILRKRSFATLSVPIPSLALVQEFFAMFPELANLRNKDQEEMIRIYNILAYEINADRMVDSLGDQVDHKFLREQAAVNSHTVMIYVSNQLKRQKLVDVRKVLTVANDLVESVSKLNASPLKELETLDVGEVAKKLWGKSLVAKKWEDVP